MSHNNVFEQFKFLLPQYIGYVDTWFPNGKNSIRVRRTHGYELVFTFNGIDDWCLETVDSFLNRMKGDNAM